MVAHNCTAGRFEASGASEALGDYAEAEGVEQLGELFDLAAQLASLISIAHAETPRVEFDNLGGRYDVGPGAHRLIG